MKNHTPRAKQLYPTTGNLKKDVETNHRRKSMLPQHDMHLHLQTGTRMLLRLHEKIHIGNKRFLYQRWKQQRKTEANLSRRPLQILPGAKLSANSSLQKELPWLKTLSRMSSKSSQLHYRILCPRAPTHARQNLISISGKAGKLNVEQARLTSTYKVETLGKHGLFIPTGFGKKDPFGGSSGYNYTTS